MTRPTIPARTSAERLTGDALTVAYGQLEYAAGLCRTGAPDAAAELQRALRQVERATLAARRARIASRTVIAILDAPRVRSAA